MRLTQGCRFRLTCLLLAATCWASGARAQEAAPRPPPEPSAPSVAAPSGVPSDELEGTSAKDPSESDPSGAVAGPQAGEASVGTEQAQAPASAETDAVQSADDELALAVLTEQASAQTEPKKLELFGFADFAYRQFVFGKGTQWNRLLPEGRRAQFLLGNLNVYLRGNLAAQWTSLAEVRFHFSPTGDRLDQGDAVLDPSTSDFADAEGTDVVEYGRKFDRGSIEIERAYIEYSPHPLVAVRAGRFLTPYGIWNVDHGSPVVIDVTRPYIIGDTLLPEAQTGLEVYGQTGWGRLDAGYHLTLSNGRGPIEQIGDLDGNKGLGARLWLSTHAHGDLTVGGSSYYGRFTDRRLSVVDVAAQSVDWKVWESYRELGLAADVRYQLGGLLVVSEVISQQAVWDDDARPIPTDAQTSTPNAPWADRHRWGTYGLVGYRFEWLGLMPFGLFQYYSTQRPDSFGGASKLVAGSFGLNARVVPTVVVKLVYAFVHFPDAQKGTPPESDLQLLSGQVAWAF